MLHQMAQKLLDPANKGWLRKKLCDFLEHRRPPPPFSKGFCLVLGCRVSSGRPVSCELWDGESRIDAYLSDETLEMFSSGSQFPLEDLDGQRGELSADIHYELKVT